MKLTVNQSILSSLMNDTLSDNEIIEFLNFVIDEELEKVTPDCDLIDDCIDAIDTIERDNNKLSFLKLVLTKKDLLQYCRQNTKNHSLAKSVIAAALAIVIGGSAVLATTPALADGVRALFDVIVSTLLDTTSDADIIFDDISSIYAVFSEEENLTITDIDDIDISKITVTAVMNDGTERAIDISDCKVNKKVEQTANGEFVIVSISYGDCACTMAFEITR